MVKKLGRLWVFNRVIFFILFDNIDILCNLCDSYVLNTIYVLSTILYYIILYYIILSTIYVLSTILYYIILYYIKFYLCIKHYYICYN